MSNVTNGEALYFGAATLSGEIGAAVGATYLFGRLDSSYNQAQGHIDHLRTEDSAIVTLHNDGLISGRSQLAATHKANEHELNTLIAHEPAHIPQYEQVPAKIGIMLVGAALGFGLAAVLKRTASYTRTKIVNHKTPEVQQTT
jgi:hypothetical protein